MRLSLSITTLTLALSIPVAPVLGQAVRRSGIVLEAVSRTPVGGAIVSDRGDRRRAVVTDEGGRWSLVLPESASVIVAHLGYTPDAVDLSGRGTILVELRPRALSLAPARVVASIGGTAMARTFEAFDVALRPRNTSQDLLRLAPGLVVAQHAGGGKAEQIFLRGFDADHGTDVAISVDGTPVNVVTHAHGQGDADLHFLLPSVVERVQVRKGPYDVEDGDFATAGAVAFQTKARLEGATIASEFGAFGQRAVSGALPLGRGSAENGGWVAAAAGRADGPFVLPQALRRMNVMAKWNHGVGATARGTITGSHYDARWNAPGQIPERAVAHGLTSRFGAVDSSEGGWTQRTDAALSIESGSGSERGWRIRSYATRHRFQLYSNFTLFAVDSVNGYGIEQRDDRTVVGLQGDGRFRLPAFGVTHRLRTDIGARRDDAEVALTAAPRRAPLRALFRGTIGQTHGYAFVSDRVLLGSRAALEVGSRLDAIRYGVQAQDDSRAAATHVRASPRGTLTITPRRGPSLVVSAGAGFHSNDGRTAAFTGEVRDALPRAIGAELGLRQVWNRATLAVTAWTLDLERELVYVGDAGTVEASGRTRRRGLDVEGRLQLADWVWADADLSLARGRFRDAPAGEDRIPLAPSRTATAGLTARRPDGLEGALRVRHVAPRPADETNSVVARGHTLVELVGATQMLGGRLRLTASIENLLNVTWNEAQFATTSRLLHEAAPSTELHFTPGTPRAARLGVELRR